MPSPYFESASKQVDESRKGLLEAVAQGGSAGKAAFDAAQAQAAQARQGAVARAAERSALYGVGGDSQTFLGAYDARLNQMGVNRTNFESGLAQTQASGESYLEKARASIPLLEAQNIGKVTDAETKIKLAIEAAKQKALAEQEKEARAEQRRLESESRSESRAIARENRAVARDAAKAPKISADALLGAASQQQRVAAPIAAPGAVDFGGPQRPDESIEAYLARLNQAAQGRRTAQPGIDQATQIVNTPLSDLAASIGRQLGVPETTIMEMYSPGKQSSLYSATKNLSKPEQMDANARALATKYDTKGVNYDTAKSVLGNVDYQGFVKWIMGGAKNDKGAPLTRAEVQDSIYQKFIAQDNRNWTAEYNILVGEYLPLIPE